MYNRFRIHYFAGNMIQMLDHYYTCPCFFYLEGKHQPHHKSTILQHRPKTDMTLLISPASNFF